MALTPGAAVMRSHVVSVSALPRNLQVVHKQGVSTALKACSGAAVVGICAAVANTSRSRLHRRCTGYVALSASTSGSLVEVVDAGPGRGFGLVAPMGADAGAVLCDEEPILRKPKGLPASDLVALVNQLPQDKRAKLLQMAATEGCPQNEAGFHGEDLTALRAIRTNSVALPDGGGAVYAIGCRANHSCRPNASLRVGSNARLQLKALRSIEAGEDVLVSYIGEGDLLRPQARRQELINSWGFLCDCDRCVGPDDARGFQCISCNEGILNLQQSTSGGTRWGPCDCCQTVLPSETLDGAEQEWVQHASALRPSPVRDQMAFAMYKGLIAALADSPTSAPAADGHWVPAKLAGIAAEEMIRQGDGQGAVQAGNLVRRYVHRTLGPVASRATAQVTCIEADAAVLAGEYDEAEKLYQSALLETSLLPRSADKLMEQIESKLQALQQEAVSSGVEGALSKSEDVHVLAVAA
eukprot:TRINITY_DN57400_c0_g1_i1.p1 TRINITY_DN57400_c0_g1~~TRINITY_DN57400_c0_g1_i1.p1  ORF type:complete len:487 (-),score=76.68 TRINITY_DN57400_c0_g1_i1:198-1601(-)